MNAKELSEHIKNATKSFGLLWHETDLVKISIDTVMMQIIFSYENLEYRVKI